ncbi:MAG: hypothetical protein A3K09_03250, partial [Nitrospinae bacterium RIFCSPLOWO2_12_FULL_47_7]
MSFDTQTSRMKNEDGLKQAKLVALKYLSYRNRSSHEVGERLAKKGFSPLIIQETLDYLRKLNYLNDENFARTWGQSRTQTRKIGKQRLKQELLAKGLDPELAGNAVKLIYSEVDELELAKDCVKKKLAGLKEMPIEKKRGRMAQFLARKGFNAVVI